MKKTLFGILLVVGASVGAAGSAHAENAMYSCTDASGTVSLTNVPQGDCVQLFTYTPPAASSPAVDTSAPPPSAAKAGIVAEVGAPAPAAAETKTAAARRASNKPLFAQRHDDAIQQTRDAYNAGQPSLVGNPATNRRYLMTNRVDFQKALGIIQ